MRVHGTGGGVPAPYLENAALYMYVAAFALTYACSRTGAHMFVRRYITNNSLWGGKGQNNPTLRLPILVSRAIRRSAPTASPRGSLVPKGNSNYCVPYQRATKIQNESMHSLWFGHCHLWTGWRKVEARSNASAVHIFAFLLWTDMQNWTGHTNTRLPSKLSSETGSVLGGSPRQSCARTQHLQARLHNDIRQAGRHAKLPRVPYSRRPLSCCGPFGRSKHKRANYGERAVQSRCD